MPVNHRGFLTSPQLAEAFGGVKMTVKKWKTKLGDTENHRWLLPARRSKGTAPKPSTWCPVAFAHLLRERGPEVIDQQLSRAFLSPALKPWMSEWQEATRERNAFGQ